MGDNQKWVENTFINNPELPGFLTQAYSDFDHLSIIHKFGRYVEESHYYPYGMLIEGLSSVSKYAPSNYKFNGDYYETRNELYNHLTPFRTYDPAIARWNQIDPINEFSNGYFAFCDGNGNSKFSPNGCMYASSTQLGGVDLFHFNRCSGLMSNNHYIDLPDSLFINFIEFSPDSRLLYAAASVVVN